MRNGALKGHGDSGKEYYQATSSHRGLTADHDEALADLILERVEHPARVRKTSAATRRHANSRHAGPGPVLITLAIATFMSLVGALESHASVLDFLLLWFLLAAVAAAVMQIGLYLGTFRVPEQPRRV